MHFKIFLLFLWLTTLSFHQGIAQSSLDRIAAEIEIDNDTIEAIFRYVAENTTYDTHFKDAEYHSYDEVLADVLDDKKGVCMHYAALFHALCKKFGFESYIISGYTKIYNESEGKAPHAWNAVKSNGEWNLYDPTWASGYVMGDKFFTFYERTWYKRKPEEFIYSHVPFDPIWQLRNQPSSHEEIYRNQYTTHNSPVTDFEKEIKKYNNQKPADQLSSSLERIKKSGITNIHILNKIKYLEEQIQIHQHNEQVYAYHSGLELLNTTKSELYNYQKVKVKYIKEMSEEEALIFISSVKENLAKAAAELEELNVSNTNLKRAINHNLKQSSQLLEVVEKEEKFISRYYKSWKPLRFLVLL